MRPVNLSRKHKRGCGYCLDYIPTRKVGKTTKRARCPFDVCPYHELDKYKKYEEYVSSLSSFPIETLIAILCEDSHIKKQKFALKSHKSVI